MTKPVKKALIITICSVVMALAIAFILLLTCFPTTLANIYNVFGLDGMSAELNYSTYQKTNDIVTLNNACQSSLKTDNDELIFKCYDSLCEHNDFATFCAEMENGDDYYSFATSKCITYMYKLNKKENIIDRAVEYSQQYLSGNAVKTLMRLLFGDSDKANLIALQTKMAGITGLAGDRLTDFNNDKNVLSQMINAL